MNGPPVKSAILCLATEKGLAVAESLATASFASAITICTFRETNVSECFEERIRSEALKRGCRHVSFTEWKNNSAAVVGSVDAELIVCVGWKYLISEEVSALVGGNIVVAHDSLLPKLRGFAPLPTALIAGDQKAGVTFLQASDSVDAGPIYWQREFEIESSDTIRDLIRKTLPLYQEGVHLALTGRFASPRLQNELNATYSIWRDEEDYRINWTESAEVIERTIRALGPPYLGARTTLYGQDVIVSGAVVVQDLSFAIRQPGKVWSIDSRGRPTVVCDKGMLLITSAHLVDGTAVVPMKRLRVRFK